MSWSDYCDAYGLTPAEAKIFALLSDGKIHTGDDLMRNGLGKRHAVPHLVNQHIYRMRPKIKLHGFAVEAIGRGHTAEGFRLRTPPAPLSMQEGA